MAEKIKPGDKVEIRVVTDTGEHGTGKGTVLYVEGARITVATEHTIYHLKPSAVTLLSKHHGPFDPVKWFRDGVG
jgi:hypothetical protein